MRSAFDTSYGVDSPYDIVVSLAVRSAEHQGAAGDLELRAARRRKPTRLRARLVPVG